MSHLQEPKFLLTTGLASWPTGPSVTWTQAFESAAVSARIEHIVVPANEQNLDRLTAEVLRHR